MKIKNERKISMIVEGCKFTTNGYEVSAFTVVFLKYIVERGTTIKRYTYKVEEI